MKHFLYAARIYVNMLCPQAPMGGVVVSASASQPSSLWFESRQPLHRLVLTGMVGRARTCLQRLRWGKNTDGAAQKASLSVSLVCFGASVHRDPPPYISHHALSPMHLHDDACSSSMVHLHMCGACISEDACRAADIKGRHLTHAYAHAWMQHIITCLLACLSARLRREGSVIRRSQLELI